MIKSGTEWKKQTDFEKKPELFCLFLRCNLSPRGDGNTLQFSNIVLQSRCNLSPRGDGNAGRQIKIYILKRMQLIPARGRKPSGGCVILSGPGCNLSPRGDGNSQISPAVWASDDATYPREGTETILPVPLQMLHWDATYPREGTETH